MTIASPSPVVLASPTRAAAITPLALIIPDIHERHLACRHVLAEYGDVPRRIFLSDWFDSFETRGVGPALLTAELIKELLPDPRNTFLLGNHDASYRWGGPFRCSGFSLAKSCAISSILTPDDWRRFTLCTSVDRWLISHAGLHPDMAHQLTGFSDPTYFRDRLSSAIAYADMGRVHPWLRVGRVRGGDHPYGGLTWLDWDYEFVPIPGIHQLVGHTEHTRVLEKSTPDSKNFCLDTQFRTATLILSDGSLKHLNLSPTYTTTVL